MKLRSLSLLPLLMLSLAKSQEREFFEKFADPEKREQALKMLAPQSSEWFHYHSLQLLHLKKFKEFDELVLQWEQESSKSSIGIHTNTLPMLKNRAMLLRHANDATATATAIQERFPLNHKHHAPSSNPTTVHPDKIRPEEIAEAAFLAKAEQSNSSSWEKMSHVRLLKELPNYFTSPPEVRGKILQRIVSPHDANALELFSSWLSTDVTNFSAWPATKLLTRSQCDSLLAKHPQLLTQTAFVEHYLRLLAPVVESGHDQDPEKILSYWQECDAFLQKTKRPMSHYQEVALRHLLLAQQALGKENINDLKRYLRLPTSPGNYSRVANTASMITGESILSADGAYQSLYRAEKMIDQKWLESLLIHFLKNDNDPESFADLIPEDSLKPLHAQARLLHGGDEATWGKFLKAEEMTELRQRTELRFSPTQENRFSSSQEKISLVLDCKNTPTIEVSIYALDLTKHHLNHQWEPDATLAIDGIVPQRQFTRSFTQAELIRHREEIVIDQLAGAGAWLIECMAKGVSTRMLVRKGMLHPYVENTAGGVKIHVFDETGKNITDFRVWHGSKEYQSTKQGTVLLPIRQRDDAPRHAVVALPEISSNVSRMAAIIDDLPNLAAPLLLRCGFHLDQEQLLSEKRATLYFHPEVTRLDVKQDTGNLLNPRMNLKFVHFDGSEVSKIMPIKDLSTHGTLEFDVPNNCKQLIATLRAEIPASDSQDAIPLESASYWEFHQGLCTDSVEQAYFTNTPTEHLLELRGRNGEFLANRPLTLTFHHKNFDRSCDITLTLQTNAAGQVSLGKLSDITDVECSVNGKKFSYQPTTLEQTRYPEHISAAAFTDMTMALSPQHAAETPMRIHLLKKNHADAFPASCADHLIRDGRTLTLRQLPPGKFLLQVGDVSINVLILDAKPQTSPLCGKEFITQSHLPSATHIRDCRIEGENLVIEVSHATSSTKVDIVATAFAPTWELQRPANSLPIYHPSLSKKADIRSAFLIDRILDEETRYIMERRKLKTFPGNMLDRPGKILRRLAEENDSAFQVAPDGMSEGDAFASSMRGDSFSSKAGLLELGMSNEHLNCDFLATPSRVFYQLPVTNGRVMINKEKLAGYRNLQLIAWNGRFFDQRTMPWSDTAPATRERTLLRPLDESSNYATTRRSLVLKNQAETTINQMIDAKWQAYLTLDDAFQFFHTQHPELASFQVLTKWNQFDEKQKINLWNLLGCHEMDLFLAQKDPKFFAQFVKPALAQKTDRRFMDEYLLGNDLSAWRNIARWNELNAAEKALLCRALPEAESLRREIRDQTELLPQNTVEEEMRFARLLNAATLEEKDRLGIATGTVREMLAIAEAAAVDRGVITAKLNSIIIPMVNLEDCTIHEAVDFLAMRSRELDGVTENPAEKGINIEVSNRMKSGDSSNYRIRLLKLQNVPLSEALRQVCEATRLKYTISERGVTVTPIADDAEELVTRVFQVPPDLMAQLTGPHRQDDPFAPPIREKLSAKAAIIQSGVPFPEKGTAQYNPTNGTLTVRNYQKNLAVIEQLFKQLGLAKNHPEVPSFPVTPATPATPVALDPFGNEREYEPPQLPSKMKEEIPPATINPRIFIEHRYWKQKTDSDMYILIPQNRFWNDVAAWDGKQPFLSPHFGDCDGMNAALLCLALLDLPFEAQTPETRIENNNLSIKAKQNMLLFFRDTRTTKKIEPTNPILIRQSFYPLAERFSMNQGIKRESRIEDGKFLTGIAYGSTLSLTNISGTAQETHILAQIPRGAVALSGGASTISEINILDPNQSMELSYSFYFPAEIDTKNLPIQVSNAEETIIGQGKSTAMNVKKVHDRAALTFEEIAATGSAEDVLKQLESINLQSPTLNLKAILWRLENQDFYQKASAILRRRMCDDSRVFSYALRHSDAAGIRVWLENQQIYVGPWFESPWLTVRPKNDVEWIHREFDPFVNPRAHRLGTKETLPLDKAIQQYQTFLSQLAYKEQLTAEDHWTLCMFLLMQNRIDEAIVEFQKINPTGNLSKMAYDYLRAYLLFYEEKPAQAKEIAMGYKDQPLELWRKRFSKIITQADEIARATAPDTREDVAAVVKAASLEISDQANGTLLLKQQQLSSATISFYQVDMELMFSAKPFLDNKPDSLELVRPNQLLKLNLDQAEMEIKIPQGLGKGDILAVAESGNFRSIAMLDSPTLDCRKIPNTGEIVACEKTNSKPLPRSYVKVYAMEQGGAVVFHKDGYTDLRGRFDYRSHSSRNPETIKRFALFIHHPEHGSRVEIYDGVERNNSEEPSP